MSKYSPEFAAIMKEIFDDHFKGLKVILFVEQKSLALFMDIMDEATKEYSWEQRHSINQDIPVAVMREEKVSPEDLVISVKDTYGFWNAFLTVGFKNPDYNRLIKEARVDG